MTLSRNLLFGLASSAWTAIIGLAVVPQYIKYLGVESYGLIGFFVTTQALLQLLDMGIAPTVNREVARSSVSGKTEQVRNLLHTLACVYWGIAGLIAVSIIFLAPSIASSWLNSKLLTSEEISHAVILMGVVIACRWPIGLYQGVVIGAQRLAVSSIISMVMVTLGSLGAVVVLKYVSPTIEAFFIWQAGVGFVYAIVIRWAAWIVLKGSTGRRLDLVALKRVWRFSAGMGIIALSSVVFSQIDKIMLSKILTLEEFGHYMLATVVVSGLYLLVTPVFNIIYPRFSALVANGDNKKITDLYRLGTRVLASVLFPIAMLVTLFAKELVTLWLGDEAIAESVGPIIAILVIGSALHGVMYFPYALQLSYGQTRLALTNSIILMIIFVPLIIYFSFIYGALGGALAWLTLHVIYLFLGSWLTHRTLLKKIGTSWLLQDVGGPLVISTVVGLVSFSVIRSGEYSAFVKLMSGIGISLVVFILSVAMSEPFRRVILNKLESKK